MKGNKGIRQRTEKGKSRKQGLIKRQPDSEAATTPSVGEVATNATIERLKQLNALLKENSSKVHSILAEYIKILKQLKKFDNPDSFLLITELNKELIRISKETNTELSQDVILDLAGIQNDILVDFLDKNPDILKQRNQNSAAVENFSASFGLLQDLSQELSNKETYAPDEDDTRTRLDSMQRSLTAHQENFPEQPSESGTVMRQGMHDLYHSRRNVGGQEVGIGSEAQGVDLGSTGPVIPPEKLQARISGVQSELQKRKPPEVTITKNKGKEELFEFSYPVTTHLSGSDIQANYKFLTYDASKNKFNLKRQEDPGLWEKDLMFTIVSAKKTFGTDDIIFDKVKPKDKELIKDICVKLNIKNFYFKDEMLEPKKHQRPDS